MQNLTDVTELLTEMHIAGVPTHQAVEWIARAIRIGKAAERAAQEEARRESIRIKVRAEESAQ
jgi:DNA mismatch repair ATPase MutS